MWQKQKKFVGVSAQQNESSRDDCHGAQGRSEISSVANGTKELQLHRELSITSLDPQQVTISQRVLCGSSSKLVASLGVRNPEIRGF